MTAGPSAVQWIDTINSATAVAAVNELDFDPSNDDFVIATSILVGPSDLGDAPDMFGTLISSYGALHTATGPTRGPTRDAETDGRPSPNADGDDTDGSDNEDGITFTGPIMAGALTAPVTVNASSAAKLDAWIDFNADGTFGGANEQVFTSRPLVAGDNNLTFMVPADARQGTTGQFEAVLALSAPPGADKLLIKVDGSTASAVTDPGGTALDGEWADTTDTFPSGDGSAGGDFHLRFNSLPGDADIDGSVGDNDLNIVLSDFGKAPPTPLIEVRADLDGDLSVGDRDLNILLTNFGKSLPTGVPTAPLTHGVAVGGATSSMASLATPMTSDAAHSTAHANASSADASGIADVDLIATMQVLHRGSRRVERADNGILWRFARPSMQAQHVVRLHPSYETFWSPTGFTSLVTDRRDTTTDVLWVAKPLNATAQDRAD